MRELLLRQDDPARALDATGFCATRAVGAAGAAEREPAVTHALRAAARAVRQAGLTPLQTRTVHRILDAASILPSCSFSTCTHVQAERKAALGKAPVWVGHKFSTTWATSFDDEPRVEND